MCWNIFDICIIISEAHPFRKKQPPKTPKKPKKNKPLILYFNIMSSNAEIMLFTKHVLQSQFTLIHCSFRHAKRVHYRQERGQKKLCLYHRSQELLRCWSFLKNIYNHAGNLRTHPAEQEQDEDLVAQCYRNNMQYQQWHLLFLLMVYQSFQPTNLFSINEDLQYNLKTLKRKQRIKF